MIACFLQYAAEAEDTDDVRNAELNGRGGAPHAGSVVVVYQFPLRPLSVRKVDQDEQTRGCPSRPQ